MKEILNGMKISFERLLFNRKSFKGILDKIIIDDFITISKRHGKYKIECSDLIAIDSINNKTIKICDRSTTRKVNYVLSKKYKS